LEKESKNAHNKYPIFEEEYFLNDDIEKLFQTNKTCKSPPKNIIDIDSDSDFTDQPEEFPNIKVKCS